VPRKVHLRSALDAYFEKLRRDAKRAKQPFNSEFEGKEGSLCYRYMAHGQGRGKLMVSEPSNRLLFLEVVGARKDQLLPTFRLVEAGLVDYGRDEWEVWSLLGLRFRSPVPLTLERKLLQAGRTQLCFRARSLRLIADRWGFGEQLIQKHGLQSWAQAALGLNGAPEQSDESRIAFGPKGWLNPVSAIVQYDAARNQIIALKATSRNPNRRPSWDWLDF